jgi:L-aminopeptidase/D-esterase-like protein
MLVGRAGAGTTTTGNKISQPIWGGQGAAFREVRLSDGSQFKIFTAVVVNAHGDIKLPTNVTVNAQTLAAMRAKASALRGVGKNTTLSLVVTDVSLDRNQLKRLATMVHTSMGSVIQPFHSYTDGDILFSVSLNQRPLPHRNSEAFEEFLQIEASRLMGKAILNSVTVSNKYE